MKFRFERVLIALSFALAAAGFSLAFAQAKTIQPGVAQEETPTPQPSSEVSDGTPANKVTYDNCNLCHKDMQDVWSNGPHGQAFSDPVFAASWNDQGQPGACLICHTTGYDPASGTVKAQSVSCEACHSPIPPNHPQDSMPINNSPDQCGTCHSDPRFSVQNWKLSSHYQRDMTCTVCHDPHTAGMKAVQKNTAAQKDASDLCENCHKDAMQNFPASKHAEAGVTCVNCHLGFNVPNTNDPSTAVDFAIAHKAPDHGFVPVLDTCNRCHSGQMHGPGVSVAVQAIKAEEVGGTPTPEPTAVVTAIPPITNQPTPVSPIGFAGMAGLLGLAGGMVLAPWLERLYRRIMKEGKNDSD